MDGKKEKKSITVFHVHLKMRPSSHPSAWDTLSTDYYFGSISAIYDYFINERRFNNFDIGIKASSLYNLNMDEEANPIYENSKCWIRKASLITKPKKPKEKKL